MSEFNLACKQCGRYFMCHASDHGNPICRDCSSEYKKDDNTASGIPLTVGDYIKILHQLKNDVTSLSARSKVLNTKLTDQYNREQNIKNLFSVENLSNIIVNTMGLQAMQGIMLGERAAKEINSQLQKLIN